MQESLTIHNHIIRDKINEYNGYEVKTEGDSFLIAFSDPENAIRFCLDLQDSLLVAPWPSVCLFIFLLFIFL